MKKKYIIIAVLVIVVAAAVIANLMKKEKGISVETAKVESGDVIQKVTGSGQLQPEVQVKISANVAGKIIKMYAEEGDIVKKGQLLVELEQEQYLAALERAESNLLSVKANQKKLKSEMIRANDLFDKGLMSSADFEAVEAQHEAAISNTKQAVAQVKEAKDYLAKTRLHSDMDGIVTVLNKEKGEIALGAQFQEDVIMIVADLSRMESSIEIDENDVVNVSLDDTCIIEIDAFPDTSFNGIVTQIANSATIKGLGTQEQVTNFEVVVALLDKNEKFRPGMSTTVDVFTETKKNVLKVPISAVTVREKDKLKKEPDIEDRPEEEKVKTFNEKKKDLTEVVFCVEGGKAVAKNVKLGISDDYFYHITSGLNEDDEVITGPFSVLSRSLQDGDMVETKDKDKKDD